MSAATGANQALEGQLADQQLGDLLVLANLTQSNSAGGSVAMGLLDAACKCRGVS